MTISGITSSAIAILSKMGYLGVIAIMALESTCLPVFIPSEVFLISYGASAYKGEMHIILIILSATLGIVIGSLINYYMAAWLGRSFLYKYGKYFFLDKDKLRFWEVKFLKYSKLIIFFGRFIPIPAIKHIVTLPAGLSRMSMKVFLGLSTLGGLIFSTIVVLFGYWFGKKAETVENYSHFMNKFVIGMILFIVIPIIAYKIYHFFQKRSK